jgi:hypothetical protein
LYFAACTQIQEYTKAVSATPLVTNGIWRVSLLKDANNDHTTAFNTCTLKFESSGEIIAFKNGKRITGNWAEDDISKKMTISLHTNDPDLVKLNDYWTMFEITSTGHSFQNTGNSAKGLLHITNL